MNESSMRRYLPALGLLFATWAFGPVGASLEAQRVPGIGGAAGYGLGGMTEARGLDAPLWNPALTGIFEGPASSWSVFGIEGELGDVYRGAELYRHRRGLQSVQSTIGPGGQDSFAGWAGDGEVATLAGSGSIQWFGAHSRDLAISLTSLLDVDINMPARAARIAAGDEVARTDPLTSSEQDRAQSLTSRGAMTTQLAVATGSDTGLQPYLGRTWVGGGLRVGYVHSHFRGATQLDEVRELAFDDDGLPKRPDLIVEGGEIGFEHSEVAVSGGRLYSADVGAAINPWPPLFLSATLTNAIHRTSISASDVVHRQYQVAGSDSIGHPAGFWEEQQVESFSGDQPWLDDADHLVRSTAWQSKLRLGASFDLEMGRFFGGGEFSVSSGEALHGGAGDRFSGGFQLFHELNPRISYSRRHDGADVFRLGGEYGNCEQRYSFDVGYVAHPRASGGLSVSFSLMRGEPPCG